MNSFLFGTLQLIKDSNGAPYLAAVLGGDPTLLNNCRAHLVSEGLANAVAARDARDGVTNAHVTIASVAEWGKLLKNNPDAARAAERFMGTEVTFELHGIGKATSQKNSNTAWYGILSGEDMETLRGDLGMQAKDFHITLAFDPKDVFDSAKDLTTLIVPLAQLLRPRNSSIDSGTLGPSPG